MKKIFSFILGISMFLSLSLSHAQTTDSSLYRHSKNRIAERHNPAKHYTWFTNSKNKNHQQHGLSGDMLQKNAVLGSSSKIVDKNIPTKETPKHEKGLNFYYDQGINRWQPRPRTQKDPDEDLVLGGEHHIKAFTDVNSSDDFSLSVGPEIILKEHKQNNTLNKTNQPNSQIGVGMRFSYDF